MNPEESRTNVSFGDYLAEQGHRAGGWRGFVHTPLFATLLVWIMGQILLGVIGLVTLSRVIGHYETKIDHWEIEQKALQEWRTTTDERIKSHDETGTHYGQWVEKELRTDLGRLDGRITRVEDETRHSDVWESENRRLTNDVEKLKDYVERTRK